MLEFVQSVRHFSNRLTDPDLKRRVAERCGFTLVGLGVALQKIAEGYADIFVI